jgi:hypothetical protein
VRKVRILIVGAALALSTVASGATPANASHRCGLEDPTLNTICENYHSPKPLIGYLFCLVSPTC